jgi:carboxyl-terminal processing protease
LTKDTSLKITVAHWLTPNGNSISNGGLTPDIKVELTAENTKGGNDPQLNAAVEYLTR